MAYLSARRAADYCGCSEKTIRNLVAAGRLSAERTSKGFRIPVDQLAPFRAAGASGSTESAPTLGPTADSASSAEPDRRSAAELVALVERQQQTIMELAGRVGFLQSENQQLRLALEGPKMEQAAPEPPTAEGPAVEPATRPWWRFWA